MRSLIKLLSMSLLAVAPAWAQSPVDPYTDPAPTPAPTPAPAEDAPVRSVSAANVSPPKKLAANGLGVITVSQQPAKCRDIAKRATAPARAQALPARVSLANCLADVSVANLELIDGAAAILEIDDAIAPSLAYLDEVVREGEPQHKVMAHAARAQLYANVSSRMRSTVPAPASSTPEALALRDSRLKLVEQMLAPWREEQLVSHQAIVDLAKANPALSKNQIAANAIRASRDHVAQHQAVAARIASQDAQAAAANAPKAGDDAPGAADRDAPATGGATVDPSKPADATQPVDPSTPAGTKPAGDAPTGGSTPADADALK